MKRADPVRQATADALARGQVWEGIGQHCKAPILQHRRITEVDRAVPGDTVVCWEGAGVPEGYARTGHANLTNFLDWVQRRVDTA